MHTLNKSSFPLLSSILLCLLNSTMLSVWDYISREWQLLLHSQRQEAAILKAIEKDVVVHLSWNVCPVSTSSSSLLQTWPKILVAFHLFLKKLNFLCIKLKLKEVYGIHRSIMMSICLFSSVLSRNRQGKLSVDSHMTSYQQHYTFHYSFNVHICRICYRQKKNI